MKSLEDELEAAQRQVRTDSISMSIGELASMYDGGELIINPVFQRLFRWEPHQKSKLIESILLGIPIPPIFLFETNKGNWELVDGLQRVSTIFEFMGILREPGSQDLRHPSVMEPTTYLSSFKNTVWDKSSLIPDVPEERQEPLSRPVQFEFKRARLNLQILKRPSDVHTKYDLFQRLNSGGSIATPQEVRNCAVIMASEEFYHYLESLAKFASFKRVSRISSKGDIIQKPLEFVTRFVTFLYHDFDSAFDVEEYIDKLIIELAEQPAEFVAIEDTFRKTFALLDAAEGAEALRRYDPARGAFVGHVGQVALEGVAVGIGRNLAAISALPDPAKHVSDRIKAFWAEPAVKEFAKPGLSGGKRLQATLPFGADFFKP
jgi:hypothetical protein